VFICDDSTQAECRSRIDAFVQRFPEEVTVVRRNGHVGFKAGNLNHCLRKIHQEFDWFLVCDADGLPDQDFLERLCNHVGGIPEETWSRVAFVQTRQAGNPGQAGFGGVMGPAVEMHFDTLVQARAADADGFVMFYGHGAVISMEAWRQVAQALGTEGQPQGLPEIVTEDLAFTLMCRKLGWHGVYAPEVTCYEDFPASYGQLRKRADKWIRGTGECLAWVWKKSRLANCNEWMDKPRSKLSWVERFDILIHAGQHALALPMLIFLILAGWYLPSEVKELRGQGFFLAPIPDGKNLVQYTLEWRYRTFWTWDFFLVMLFAIAMPLVPAVGRLWRSPRKLWRHLTTTVFLCHASLLAEALSVVVFLLSGRAHFRVTGDRQDGNSEVGIEGAVAKRRSLREWIGAYHPNAAWVFVAEILLGTWLFYTAWNLKNIWVFGPACALLTSPLLHVLGWENRLVRLLMHLPIVVLGAMLVIIGKQLCGW
jgi:cellulose synthase/poly-beta-1,6-N-acetylglucosamine synthase-like glycosyltransferase